MVAVRTTFEETPELREILATRSRNGLGTYDEWWDGEFRIVTGPTPEHGRLLLELGWLLRPLVVAGGFHIAAPVNIGCDKADCRVPDLGVYEPDTPRSSPAFLLTALLVVEVLSPGEVAGEKLDFYAARGVQEYLEVDLSGNVRLLGASDAGWERLQSSPILGFDVGDTELVVPLGDVLDLAALRGSGG